MTARYRRSSGQVKLLTGAKRLGALVAVAWPRPCPAEPAPTYSVVVAPNAVCPDAAPIVTHVARRVPGAAHVSASATVAGRVTVARDDVQIRAVVSVTRADGSVERAVSGSSCDDVADAVAFILALALDGDAPSSARTGPVIASSARATSEAPKSAGARTKTTVASPSAPPSPRPTVPPRARWTWGGGLLAGTSGGVAPALAFSAGLFVEVARRAPSALTQSFRLVGFHAGQTAETSVGSAELDLLAARVQACPLGLGRAPFAELCVSFDYGRLRGEGHETAIEKSSSATWYGPGALGRVGTALGRFEIGAEGGVVVPLARDRFYFLPDVTAHTIPPAAGYVGVFFGLHT